MIWEYKGEVFNPSLNPNYYGFVYKLIYTDKSGKEYSYIGKKSFKSISTLEALKSGNKRNFHNRFYNKNVNGKRVTFEELEKESNWKSYEGSGKHIPKGLKLVSKEILKLCDTKIDLTYWEDYFLMVNEVLFDKNNFNYNVAGRYYAEKITGSKPYIK